MKLVKKLVKEYFLFVSQSPIFWALIGALAFFCLDFASLTVITCFSDKSTFELARTGIDTTIILAMILSAINIAVPNLAITSFRNSRQRIILIHREGKPEIYQKPLWGKYDYKVIDLPYKWFRPLSSGNETSLLINFQIPVNDKTLLVPLKLKFHFYCEIKARDLSALLALQAEKTRAEEIISFEECVKHVFEENNLTPEKREKIREIVDDCISEKKPLIQLIVKIKEEFFFPGHIFPNAEVKIKLISLKEFWE